MQSRIVGLTRALELVLNLLNDWTLDNKQTQHHNWHNNYTVYTVLYSNFIMDPYTVQMGQCGLVFIFVLRLWHTEASPGRSFDIMRLQHKDSLPFWGFDILRFRHTEASTFWGFDILRLRHIEASAYWYFDVSSLKPNKQSSECKYVLFDFDILVTIPDSLAIGLSYAI